MEITFIVVGSVAGVVLIALTSYCYCMYRRHPERFSGLFRNTEPPVQLDASDQQPQVIFVQSIADYPSNQLPPPPKSIPPPTATGPQLFQPEGDDNSGHVVVSLPPSNVGEQGSAGEGQ